MKSNMHSKSSMIVVTRDYLNQNTSITNTITQFAALFAVFVIGVTQFLSLRELYTADRKGFRKNKEALKADLILKLCDIARRIVAYAKITGNPVLLAEVNYDEKKLGKVRDSNLRDIAQIVYTRGNTNLVALASYGVTPALLSAFKTAIDTYTTAQPKTALARKDRKIMNMQMRTSLKDLYSQLDKLDSLVDLVKITQPQFYNGYLEARRVAKSANTTLSIRGWVTDSTSNEVLSYVNFTFVPISNSSSTILTKKSTGKGGFLVRNLSAGNYTLISKKYGYKTQTQTISINSQETTKVTISMEKEG